LVKNRGFEFPDALMGWARLPSTQASQLEIREDSPFDQASPHYLRLSSDGSALCGIMNEGFRGMGVRAGEAYTFSVRVRATAGTPRMRVELVGPPGQLLGSAELKGFARDWQKRSVTLRCRGTDPKAHMNVVIEGAGSVDLDMVSLFPQHIVQFQPGGGLGQTGGRSSATHRRGSKHYRYDCAFRPDPILSPGHAGSALSRRAGARGRLAF
jgi:hypothetical protein